MSLTMAILSPDVLEKVVIEEDVDVINLLCGECEMEYGVGQVFHEGVIYLVIGCANCRKGATYKPTPAIPLTKDGL